MKRLFYIKRDNNLRAVYLKMSDAIKLAGLGLIIIDALTDYLV